ncbi:hypothetical protein ACFY00_25100 [Kitasatospora sp. NPDC001540]|uniref:hypothetical protein n=1 Tax=Kitasatospora sp. NPDC001540 TaxID=3364014 RepID=UPI00367815C7
MSLDRGIVVPLSVAAVLLVAGLALVVPGGGGHGPGPAVAPSPSAPHPPAERGAERTAAPSGTPTASPRPEPAADPAAVPSAAPSVAPSAMPSGIPAAGDGPQGDAAIQAALTVRHPSDLPAAEGDQLADLARAVWTAEVTGEGRERWPSYFPEVQGLPGRGYYFSGFRVQAAVAHSVDGDPDRATVTLLWAGTSPTGEYGDHRPASVGFVRRGDSWEPRR